MLSRNAERYSFDNITCDVVRKERFARYCLPPYRDRKRRLAGTGKLVAVHMDDRLAGLVVEAEIDAVEVLTPPPVGDVSVPRRTAPGRTRPSG
jgi:hypothetical protein